MAKNKKQIKKASQSDRLDLEGDASEAEDRAKHVHWADEIKRAKKAFKEWTDRSKKIIKLYKDERSETAAGLQNKSRMNILWSNVSVLQPALYSRTPDPNVSRRFSDKDPVSRTASLICERNLSMAMDICDFDYPMKRMRDDYLLTGRGVVWVRFSPEMGKAPLKEPVRKIYGEGEGALYKDLKGNKIEHNKVKTDEEIGEYYDSEPIDQVLSYGLELDHVIWSRFLHEPVEDWKRVGWVGKSTLMKRRELKDQFGEIGAKITLNRTFERETDGDTNNEMNRDEPNSCEVWEIWCRSTREVIWWSEAYPAGLLKEQPDPLQLTDFWPCPRPIWATMTTDSLVPVPDYCLYQDQADQIDKITDRIRMLTNAMRVVGVFNGASAGLQQLLEEGQENEMIPVDNWVWFSGTGGLKGNVDWFPIEQVANVLKTLFETRTQLRQDLYEITGISDIVRGSTQSGETATAQQLKSNFSNLRLQDRQTEMSRIARDTLRIMAEIQCEHYPDEVLLEMSGILESDEFRNGDPTAIEESIQKAVKAVEMLKHDKLRTFKIDMETDATVAADQEKEKQSRVEFMGALAPFLQQATETGQAAPEMVPLLLKMLDFGVRGFRTGRTLESAIEQFIDAAEKQQQEAEKNPQPDQPTPEQIKAEGDVKNAADKLAQETQRHADENRLKMEQATKEFEQKRDELMAKRDETMKKLAMEQQKLDAELTHREQELKNQTDKVQADIRKIEAEIKKLESEASVGAIKDMMDSVPEAPAAPTPVDEADGKAKLATSQTALMEQKIKYAGLVERMKSLKLVGGTSMGDKPSGPVKHNVTRDEFGNMLGMESEQDMPGDADPLPSDLGTENFGKPKRRKKRHTVIRHPDTGDVMGVETEEVDDTAPIPPAPTMGPSGPGGFPGQPQPDGSPLGGNLMDSTNEIAPGVQADGTPTPASQIAPVASGGNLEAKPMVRPLTSGGLP